MLWSPADKNALPSPEDMKHAKEAIFALKRAINAAYKLVKNTKLRIAKMKKSLAERKGWIAPIRRIPTEVLIDVLLRASEMDDLSPIKFTAVCRLWRRIVFATPKAWSFIYLLKHYNRHVDFRNNFGDHNYFPGYTDTYFQRSEPRLLHLGLPQAEGFYSKHTKSIIREHAHRMLCLTTTPDILSESQSSSRCRQFPYLQILTITDDYSSANIDASFFSISRFPVLQTLRLPRGCPSTGANPIISPSTFPPLQHLTVDIREDSASMGILQVCAATLKTLSISCLDGQDAPSSPIQMTFPLLRYLTIRRKYEGREFPPLVKGITPILTSLEVTTPDESLPSGFDIDMQTITHMRWDKFIAPSIGPHIRVLQIALCYNYTGSSVTGGHVACANKLKEIAVAYPSLERIELCNDKFAPSIDIMRQEVEECIEEESVKSKLLWMRRWQGNLPWQEAATVSLF
jgi:F-box-like